MPLSSAMSVCSLFSLKQTSLVLADHEEALKKKLQHNLEKLEHDKYAGVVQWLLLSRQSI